MTCNNCGQPAQGRLCSICAQVERNEERVGTFKDLRERQDDQEGDQ